MARLDLCHDHRLRDEEALVTKRRSKKNDPTDIAAALTEPQLGCRALGHVWPRKRHAWLVDEGTRPRLARMAIPCEGGCGVEKVFRMVEIGRGRWQRLGKPYLNYADTSYLLDSVDERPSREECQTEMFYRDMGFPN